MMNNVLLLALLLFTLFTTRTCGQASDSYDCGCDKEEDINIIDKYKHQINQQELRNPPSPSSCNRPPSPSELQLSPSSLSSLPPHSSDASQSNQVERPKAVQTIYDSDTIRQQWYEHSTSFSPPSWMNNAQNMKTSDGYGLFDVWADSRMAKCVRRCIISDLQDAGI
eukprot:TRINITY_DN7226_c0_g1_i1.p1 TRINITY_DN7226_c0_g1~~TRINITY_DN7226_c0_g1_i1.p1  ORF type:complete len:167 (-),score=50.27 TRINITY_DN7226_c0_g1_i1:8-508(-)